MKQKTKRDVYHDFTSLINSILDLKTDSKIYALNEKVIEKLGTALDRLDKKESGYILFSLTSSKVRKLYLLTKYHGIFTTYSWYINESLENTIDVEIHEEGLDDAPCAILSRTNSTLIEEELASAMVIENFDGFSISMPETEKYLAIIGECEGDKEFSFNKKASELKSGSKLLDLSRETRKIISRVKSNVKSILYDKIDKDDDKITKSIRFDTFTNNAKFVGEITDVKEYGGRRFFKIKWIQRNEEGKYAEGTVTRGSSPTSTTTAIYHDNKDIFRLRFMAWIPPYNYDLRNLENIPYNLVDNGRLIIAIQAQTQEWLVFISQDPKVEPKLVESFMRGIESYLMNRIGEDCNLSVEIKAGEIASLSLISYITKASRNSNLDGLRLKLKALKNMMDEYNYIIKKNKSDGSNVIITENIKYDHSKGKLTYNDFSIAADSEYVKSLVYPKLNNLLISYYRNTINEETVLTSSIDIMLNSVIRELEFYNTKIDLKLNDKIDIKLEKRSLLVYVNNKRFNRNEIGPLLREMTCYRDQKEADSFIENIGRLGLSVYIGITTGYEIVDNGSIILKFKKLKGRSNYKLILDDTDIDIKSKKVLNFLYDWSVVKNFNVRNPREKLTQLIHKSCTSTSQYLKYRALVDSSYKSYKDKALEYLKLKATETGCTFTKYNTDDKILDAIYLEGSSGHKYIIAYDSKNSYVFMDPTINSNEEYTLGKYICMVDQSNIKSNVGYDTIVAKILALKNDSVVAHTIYNLQEEL